jgi:hypothetical protein
VNIDRPEEGSNGQTRSPAQHYYLRR